MWLLPIRSNNDLGPREKVVDYGPGIYPDGFEFDSEGGVWCSSVLSNRIVRLDRNGNLQVIIDAGDPDLVEKAELAYQSNSFLRSLIDEGQDSPLGNCASLCFGGDDLKMNLLEAFISIQLSVFALP